MSSKRFAPLRIYKEDKQKLEKLVLKISFMQGKKISFPETFRRIFNIPNLPDVLEKDAFYNKRRKSLGI